MYMYSILAKCFTIGAFKYYKLYFRYINVSPWGVDKYFSLISWHHKPLSCLPYFSKEVNYEELARCTDDFNGAQLKAVCVEAVRIFFNFELPLTLHYSKRSRIQIKRLCYVVIVQNDEIE